MVRDDYVRIPFFLFIMWFLLTGFVVAYIVGLHLFTSIPYYNITLALGVGSIGNLLTGMIGIYGVGKWW